MVFFGLSGGYVLYSVIYSAVLYGGDTFSFLVVLFEAYVFWMIYQFFTKEVTEASKGKLFALFGIHLIPLIPMLMGIGCYGGDDCNAAGIYIIFSLPFGLFVSVIGLIHWWMNRERKMIP